MKKRSYSCLLVLISLVIVVGCSKSSDPTDEIIDPVIPQTIQTTLAGKILGFFSGNGKRMPQGVSLGTYTGCVTPTGWEKNLLTGPANATVTRLTDTTVSITLADGPFINNTFTNVRITENGSIISFSVGSYNENSKLLSISANTGTYITTATCLSGLPYYSGWSALNNGTYTYQTIGHIDFTGTKQ